MRDGNVKEISSKGDTVQGEFKKEVKYKGDKAKGFETEIPTFANDDELSPLLTSSDVTINAEPPNSRSLLETILFSFGPTILLVALFVFLFRRAAGRRRRRRRARPVRPLAGEARRVRVPDRQLRRRGRASTRPRSSSSRWSTS